MSYAILDCYTDEASGLGVPPYLGTYPRYLYGYLKEKHDDEIFYLTVDDLRALSYYDLDIKDPAETQKTNIKVYNLTKNVSRIREILEEIDTLYVILGVHVPGKYLSALPGTLKEVVPLIADINCRKVLTGPAVYGTQLEGGKFFEKVDTSMFSIEAFDFTYDEIAGYALAGTEIVDQIPDLRMMEIETGKGCTVGKCSFCTEPLKSKVFFRQNDDILKEVQLLYEKGERFFRLGKQTCFYSIPDPIGLLKDIRKECPDIKVLHIDNVNPIFVDTPRGHEITQAIVDHCTSGNIAAHGVESFDPEVTKANKLNCSAEVAMKAIRCINKYGSERGPDGLPKFIPGINIIFGLNKESKQTHEWNMKYLQQILDEGLLLRRINIRQVAILENTPLYEACGNKYLRKNKKYYWKWRNEIRQKIDFPMLKRIAPVGTVFTNCYAEIYDGNTTFMRQFGTYPLIVGVKGRYPLKQFYDVKITDHMLRSLTGEVVSEKGQNSP